MLIDLHNHTYPSSDDSLLSPMELIEGAKKSGLDGICITEHDWFWDPDALVKLGRRMDFLVIPGVEITTEEGHLLVFGLEEYVFGMHRTRFVKDMLDKRGGAIIVAHPYRRHFKPEYNDVASYEQSIRKACRNPIFTVADGVEVLNGRGSERENAFSLEVSQRVNLKGVGTSDAHQDHDIGRYATRFERKISGVEDLIRELKAGRFRPEPLR